MLDVPECKQRNSSCKNEKGNEEETGVDIWRSTRPTAWRRLLLLLLWLLLEHDESSSATGTDHDTVTDFNLTPRIGIFHLHDSG